MGIVLKNKKKLINKQGTHLLGDTGSNRGWWDELQLLVKVNVARRHDRAQQLQKCWIWIGEKKKSFYVKDKQIYIDDKWINNCLDGGDR